MGSAGAATLPRPRTAGSASWTLGVPRLAALQWVSGIYLLVLGMSLLLLPRSVASVSADTWQLRGAVTAATGIALLWVAGTAPPRIVAMLIYLLAAALQALFAVDFLVRGSISGAALLGLEAI